MSLSTHYEQLSAAVTSASLQDIAPFKQNLANAGNWLQTFALLEHCVMQNQVTEEVILLLRECFKRGRENNAAFHLDDNDYDFLFKKVNSVLEAYVPHTPYATTCIAFWHLEARLSHKNKALGMQLMQKAASLNCSIASVVYYYYLYFGINCEENKEKGLAQLQELYNKGNLFTISYLSYLYWCEGKTDEAYNMLKVGVELQDNEYMAGMYEIMGLMEMNAYNNMDNALYCFNEAIKDDSFYARYHLGILYVNGRGVEADEEKGLALIKESFPYNISDAGVFLGQSYNYNKNTGEAINYFTKSAQYGNAQACLELAYIYLYNNEFKNEEKGVRYLDIAVSEKNHNAMIEKAWLEAKGEVYAKNSEHAKALLSECIDKKNGYAAYQMGRMYEAGLLVEEGASSDYKKAFEYYLIAADLNNMYGLEAAGKYLLEGYESEPDVNKALEYFRRAIDMGSNFARYELALCYEAGRGVEKSLEESFKLLQAAAENNYTSAINRLGYFYEDGLVDEPNATKAFECYKKAAEMGHVTAMYETGRCYKYGTGVVENVVAATEWLLKCAETPSPNPYAWMELGHSYERGVGVEADQQKAFEYMMKAAEQNLTYAQYRLGYYYYFGMPEENLQKAVEWLQRAHEGGSPWASLLLGEYHLYNIGEDSVSEKAFEYYNAAKERGVVNEGLGACYYYGIGVEQDDKEAFNNYSVGAANKYPAAIYRLALCYLNGRGVAENAEEAFINMKEAAEADQVAAMYELGMMYLAGIGIPADAAEGVKWLTMAAENNSKYAQFELGNCYLLGKGVAEDETQAMYWFEKAAENGHEKALQITGKSKRRNRR